MPSENIGPTVEHKVAFSKMILDLVRIADSFVDYYEPYLLREIYINSVSLYIRIYDRDCKCTYRLKVPLIDHKIYPGYAESLIRGLLNAFCPRIRRPDIEHRLRESCN